jgi:hypothetical protein
VFHGDTKKSFKDGAQSQQRMQDGVKQRGSEGETGRGPGEGDGVRFPAAAKPRGPSLISSSLGEES